jgi:hypothetical protein
MVNKLCNVCGERKDEVQGFYRNCGATCKDCKKAKTSTYKAKAKEQTTQLLLDILEEQKSMNHKLEAHMEDMEREMAKLKKMLKKLSVA